MTKTAEGFSIDEVGLIIGLGAISGMFGSVFAGWLGDRKGRARPVVTALLVAGVSYLIIAHAKYGVSYITGVNLYWITYMFLFPLFIGTGAALDNSGRTATVAAATISLAIAIGPVCGGFIATWLSYSSIGWFSLMCCVLSVLAYLPTGLALDRSQRKF